MFPYNWFNPANWFLSVALAAFNTKDATMTDHVQTTTLEQNMQAFRDLITSLGNIAESLAASIANAVTERSALADRVATLEASHADIVRRAEEAEAALRQEQETSKRHWDSLTETRDVLVEVGNKLSAANVTISEMTDTVTQLQQVNDRQLELINEKDVEIERLRRRVADLEAEAEFENTTITSLREDNNDLRVNLEQVKQEYAAYREKAADDYQRLNDERIAEVRRLYSINDTLRSALSTITAAVHGVSTVLDAKPSDEVPQPVMVESGQW